MKKNYLFSRFNSLQKKFKKNIFVSICIPTYEQADNLDKCLNSISEQSFKDFEVIITDDSKSNDLVEVVNNYKNRFNILYFKNLPTKGSPENWNEAIKNAQGKYIKILHHDDYFKETDSLEQFVSLLEENPNAKVAFCSSYHIDNEGRHVSSHILTQSNMRMVQQDTKKLYLGNVIGAPSVMMYHRDMNQYFDKRMKWLVDIDFYIRLLKNNSFVYTNKELIAINIGEEQRVTKECENNAKISIYEHMILFEKLQLSVLPLRYKLYFIKLFLKFKVFNKEQIRSYGYSGNLEYVSGIFKYVKLLYPLYLVLKNTKKVY